MQFHAKLRGKTAALLAIALLIASSPATRAQVSSPGNDSKPPPASIPPASPAPTPISVPLDPIVYHIQNARKLCFGPLEIIGFPRGNMTVKSVDLGAKTSYHFTLKFSGSVSTTINIFSDREPREYQTGDPCNVSQAAQSQAIFAGKIHEAIITGLMDVSNGNIVGIRYTRFDASISETSPIERALPPGTLRLGGQRLHVTSQKIVVDNNSLSGHWNVSGSGMQWAVPMRFAQDRTGIQPMNFVVPDGFSALIDLNLGDGRVALASGQFAAQGFAPANSEQDAAISLGGLHVGYSGVSAKRVALELLSSGVFTATVAEVAFAGFTGTYQSPHVEVSDATQASARSILASVARESDSLAMSPTHIGELHLAADTVRLSSGFLRLVSAGTIDAARITKEGSQGRIDFQLAVIGSKQEGAPDIAQIENLSIVGQTSASTYSGTVAGQPKLVRLGAAQMLGGNAKLTGTFRPAGDLAFGVTEAGPSQFALSPMGNAANTYVAQLNRAALSGQFSPTSGSLRFASNGVDLRIEHFVADAGRLMGGVPFFDAGELHLKNAEPILIDQSAVLGSLDFTSADFKVQGPQVWNAAKDLGVPLGADLNSKNATVLRAALATALVTPIQGDFDFGPISIVPPPPITSITFRISDLDVETQYFRIGDLSLHAQLPEPVISAKGVDIGVGRISHANNPTISGTATTPLKADALSGSIAITADPLQLDHLTITNASFALQDVIYATPDGLRFTSGTASVTLVSLSDADASGHLELTNSHITVPNAGTSASVQRLTLAFHGPKENPAASGTIKFDTLDLVTQSPVAIPNCGANRLPVRLSTQAGGLEGPLSIADGHVSFLLAANDAHVQVYKDASPWGCEWDQKVAEILVPYFRCDSSCGGFIKYPCDCHFGQDHVSISVRWRLIVQSVRASGLIKQIKIKQDPSGSGVKVCEGKLDQLDPPIADVDVHPSIPGGNIISDTVRAGIDASVGTFSRATIESIGLLGSFLSLTHIGDSFYLFGSCD